MFRRGFLTLLCISMFVPQVNAENGSFLFSVHQSILHLRKVAPEQLERESKKVSEFVWSGKLSKHEKVSSAERILRYNQSLQLLKVYYKQDPAPLRFVVSDLNAKFESMNSNRVFLLGGGMIVAAAVGGAAVYFLATFSTRKIMIAAIVSAFGTGVAGLEAGLVGRNAMEHFVFSNVRVNPDLITH